MIPGEGKRFPILGIDQRDIENHPERPRNVPWAMLEPFEGNAKKNHDQSLQRLAERGGLDVTEMVAIIEGHTIRWLRDQAESSPARSPRERGSKFEDECWDKVIEYVKQFEGIAATELEFLRWFYQTADFGGGYEPAKQAILEEMKRSFEKTTGKKLPDGY